MRVALHDVRSAPFPHRPSAQCGFTLFEALVALAVTAIGLLGMASLQMSALSGTQSSEQRTQASFLAYDLADRMRNNVASLRAGGYGAALAGLPATSCRGAAASCTPADLAVADLREWRDLVATQLTDGAAAIATDTPPGSALTNVTITITWADTRALRLGDNQTVDQLVYQFAM